jgi:hypothetical protein
MFPIKKIIDVPVYGISNSVVICTSLKTTVRRTFVWIAIFPLRSRPVLSFVNRRPFYRPHSPTRRSSILFRTKILPPKSHVSTAPRVRPAVRDLSFFFSSSFFLFLPPSDHIAVLCKPYVPVRPHSPCVDRPYILFSIHIRASIFPCFLIFPPFFHSFPYCLSFVLCITYVVIRTPLPSVLALPSTSGAVEQLFPVCLAVTYVPIRLLGHPAAHT